MIDSKCWEYREKEDRARRDTAEGAKREAAVFTAMRDKETANKLFGDVLPNAVREFASETTSKPSNPKDSVGIRKAPMSTLPAPVLFEMGLAMMEGARKYGRHNYRAVGVRASVYYDAFMRHVAAWWEGEDTDPDSGLPHLSKAGACLVVLRDSLRRGNCNDDRPPKVDDGWVRELNELAAGIVDRYPDTKTPFTEKDAEVEGWFETMEDTEDTDECDLPDCVCHIQVETGTTAGPCEYEPRDQDW